jgi:hypothetical protein
MAGFVHWLQDVGSTAAGVCLDRLVECVTPLLDSTNDQIRFAACLAFYTVLAEKDAATTDLTDRLSDIGTTERNSDDVAIVCGMICAKFQPMNQACITRLSSWIDGNDIERVDAFNVGVFMHLAHDLRYNQSAVDIDVVRPLYEKCWAKLNEYDMTFKQDARAPVDDRAQRVIVTLGWMAASSGAFEVDLNAVGHRLASMSSIFSNRVWFALFMN